MSDSLGQASVAWWGAGASLVWLGLRWWVQIVGGNLQSRVLAATVFETADCRLGTVPVFVGGRFSSILHDART